MYLPRGVVRADSRVHLGVDFCSCCCLFRWQIANGEKELGDWNELEARHILFSGERERLWLLQQNDA